MEHHHAHHHHPPGQHHDNSHTRHHDHEAPKAEHTHDKHAGHHTGDFLKKFWICLVLTVPILLLSHTIQEWFGFSIVFPGDRYVLLALSAVIFVYGGMPFLTGMVSEARDRAIGMMTLVAIAITVSFVYSVATVFGLSGMDFFWELATLIDIMLLGHWLEMRSEMAASRALQSLVALLPSTVHIERNGVVADIDLKDLVNGDIVIIKPGEKIPADGVVLEGSSFVNESMLTGESVPVNKTGDSKVIAGSINGDGSLRVQATGTGSESYLNKVIDLVQSAQSAKSRTQNLADRVARWLTFISLAVGLAAFSYWFVDKGDLAFALERLVTVMVTACPHALGVAIPLVVAISTSQAAVNGLLIRNRTAFEKARNIDTVIFDKTGTLTRGSHEVGRVVSLSPDYSENDILQYAAGVQQHSEHYIARGIMKKLKENNLLLWKAQDFQYLQGIGVSAIVNGKKVMAMGPNYFIRQNASVPPIPEDIDQDSETVNFVSIDDRPAGIITLKDAIRESSAEAIAELRAMDIKALLLTGDNDRIASAVARQLKMDGYVANVLPHQKQERIKEFQDKGHVVAMTGDGVNDAPALAQADVGIAVGSGTDIAAETADIILVNSDPGDVVNMIAYGRATYRKMIENIFWAVGYNVIAIPLAAGILYPRFVLSPALGAVLMSLSTIIVALNAQLLKLKLVR